MKVRTILFTIAFIVGLVFYGCESNVAPNNDNSVTTLNKAFDEFGYNYNARLFNGLADGVDRNLDGNVWGDPAYANDLLNMKWSKAWDDARFNGADWTPDAWVTNHWNGQVPNGSGETWQTKIIWVGPDLQNSEYWREGGYPIWGQFEVIFEFGMVDHQHVWTALAQPAGLK